MYRHHHYQQVNKRLKFAVISYGLGHLTIWILVYVILNEHKHNRQRLFLIGEKTLFEISKLSKCFSFISFCQDEITSLPSFDQSPWSRSRALEYNVEESDSLEGGGVILCCCYLFRHVLSNDNKCRKCWRACLTIYFYPKFGRLSWMVSEIEITRKVSFNPYIKWTFNNGRHE